MHPSAANAAARAARFERHIPAGVAFNGTALGVDYAAYLAQHDLVYLRPPVESTQAMPLGDGDIGAMVWCPGHLKMQLQKCDLWADSPTKALTGSPGPASNWRQLSAGAVTLHSTPSLLEAPDHFEQRLSLYSGVMTLQAEGQQGSCQMTAFTSATAGVLVVHYQDQSLRNVERRVDVSLWRDAHLFALGEHIGILQSLPDRRYALIVRVAGKRATARMKDSRTARLEIEPYRSGHFTLYITVATSPKMIDPVSVAKTRIADAMTKGYEALLLEHRQHWGQFWKKSFLRLCGPNDDPLPSYLENLWYLTLYSMAASSRGYDVPLADGALWLHDGDRRSGPALYTGAAIRAMTAPLLSANHLELTVPYVETYQRLLPDMAAQTGSQFCMTGARFPQRFNRFGDAFDTPEAQATTSLAEKSEGSAEAQTSTHASETRTVPTPAHREPRAALDTDPLGDGLAMALFFWEAWRYAPDVLFLREHAYPLLRTCTTFALEVTTAHPRALAQPNVAAQLAAALRALLWASAELDIDADLRPNWEGRWKELAVTTLPYQPESLYPFGRLSAEDTIERLSNWLRTTPQLAQGFFARDGGVPDFERACQLCMGLQDMLLREEPLPFYPHSPAGEGMSQNYGSVTEGILHVFPALPAAWTGAFSLAAPGGFRISAEAVEGKVSYVAVQSLMGGICRLANPWGEGCPVWILNGRDVVMESLEAVLTFETARAQVYTIEREDFPMSRAVRVRLTGRRSDKPRTWEDRTMGLESNQRTRPASKG
jgi:hypothetical protein